ncbi:DUF4157 domain-containing protein [Streptomyces sp. NPDC002742]|uniref:eCIS core domain-containing protein n=1 Tax=Streptomyces sp. NPDC002742 TaxID=3364663 RepID=UPI0036D18F31
MRTSGAHTEQTEQAETRQAARGPAAARRGTSPGGAAVPPPLTPDTLQAAQHGAGNAAVTAMIARRVRPASPPEQEQQPDPGVHEVLRSVGKPLAGPVRQDMESRFGTDFSDVRLHTGATAARSARAIGARAYTSGSHVVLGAGGGDKHTLAHELTHVVQQRRGPVPGTDHGAGLRISDPSDRFERAAEANARQILSGPAPVQRATQSGAAPEPGLPGPGAVAVQRMHSDDEEDEEYLGDDESEFAEALEQDDVLGQLVQDIRACTCEPRLQQEGRSTKEAVIRYPRSQQAERAEQTLRHISIRLFNCIRYLHDVALRNTQGDETTRDADGDSAMAESSTAPATKAKDTKGKGKAKPKKKVPPRESEVQGMLINGRLVFATNRNRSITLLMEYLRAQSADQPEDAPALDLTHLMNREPTEKELRKGRPTKEADDLVAVNRRARLKIQQVYRGQRASDTADAMRRKGPVFHLEAQPTTEETVQKLRDMLTSDEYNGAVILLKHSTGPKDNPDGAESMHAEQKLMLALNSAGLSEDQHGEKILVRGVKRPCKACWAMLEHYRQRGFPLGFNNEFGAFFQESAATILDHHAQVAVPPGGHGEGNWMSEQITTKAQQGTRISAYSGERAPADAETGPGGGRQQRVTAKEVETKDKRTAFTHAEHGTGGHETVSDSDVIEESDGSLTSTFANLDLSGVRGVASADSDTDAARRRPKRPRKENLDDRPELKILLDNAMGPEFKQTLDRRKQGTSGKSNASLHYPQLLLETIATLVAEHDVSMNSIAAYLGVAPGRLTETVDARTGGSKDQPAGGDGPSAPKKPKLGGPLDETGESQLLAALPPEFAAWRTVVRQGGTAGKRPKLGAALEAVIRGMKGVYSAKSIGDFLGNVPDKSIRNIWK